MQCIATHLVSNGEKRIYTGVALACGVYVSAKDAEDDVLNLPVKKKRKKKREAFSSLLSLLFEGHRTVHLVYFAIQDVGGKFRGTKS